MLRVRGSKHRGCLGSAQSQAAMEEGNSMGQEGVWRDEGLWSQCVVLKIKKPPWAPVSSLVTSASQSCLSGLEESL